MPWLPEISCLKLDVHLNRLVPIYVYMYVPTESTVDGASGEHNGGFDIE